MHGLPESVVQLSASLRQLPGIGPRSAERIALFLVQAPESITQHLSKTMLAARQTVGICDECGGLTETQPCRICGDSDRDKALLCVVETPLDILSIERTGGFRGCYHVLGGKISPLNGVSAEDLRVKELAVRLRNTQIKELVIALPTDVEGDVTSEYLAQQFNNQEVRVSRIAHGIPVGSGLEYADELSLRKAIEGRRHILSAPN